MGVSQKPARSGQPENIHAKHRERMRARFLKGGYAQMADHEKLELLLFYACARKDTNPLAHRLLHRFGSLAGVFDAPYQELLEVDGIGEVGATLLKLVPMFLRDYESDKLSQVRLHDGDAIGSYLVKQFIGYEHQEVLMAVGLNRKGSVISCAILAEGSIDTLPIYVRKIAEHAIRSCADSIILAHNHPSGNLIPSVQDVQVTRDVFHALQLLQIPLRDHYIISGRDYMSFTKVGMLKDLFPSVED